MSLGALTGFTEKGLLIWLAALAVVVLYRCLTGDIPLSGLLSQDKGDGSPAPERVQMLIGSLLAMAEYAREALTKGVLDTPAQGKVTEHFAAITSIFPIATTHVHHVPTLPDVSPQFIALFAASHGLYLGGKWGRHAVRGRGHRKDDGGNPETSPDSGNDGDRGQAAQANAKAAQAQAAAQDMANSTATTLAASLVTMVFAALTKELAMRSKEQKSDAEAPQT